MRKGEVVWMTRSRRRLLASSFVSVVVRLALVVLMMVLVDDTLAESSSSLLSSNHNNSPASNIVDLPLGDINVVVVTDVHSWIAGHGRHEANQNADYGTVLSFYERLQSALLHDQHQQHQQKRDVFFVMNGDFMDGTGLSTIPPEHLTPILEKMPWDAVNIGNHELYFNETVEYLMDSGFIDQWKGHYLTSNTLLAATHKPLGNRYTYLYAPRTNATLLTFGFLFNFQNHCPLTLVERVQQVVQQDWFVSVLQQGGYDAILVLAHMDCVDPLIHVIHQAIRAIVVDRPSMPILFITGHSHRRAYAVLDHAAVSFEAGRYLDTVGFVSFDIPNYTASRRSPDDDDAPFSFEHAFLDANKEELRRRLGVKKLLTPSGKALSKLIHETQDSLGLNQRLGCSPSTFDLDAPLDLPWSLWRLYLDEVVPSQLTLYNDSKIFVQSTGAFRYSLFSGEVTVDDAIAVCPFNDTVYRITDSIAGSILLDAFENNVTIGSSSPTVASLLLPPFAMTAHTIDANRSYALYAPSYDLSWIVSRIRNVSSVGTTTTVVVPIPVHDNDGGESDGQQTSFVYTTNMWIGFVQQEWPCEPLPPLWPCRQHPSFPTIKHFGLWVGGLMLAVIVLASSIHYWYRKKSSDDAKRQDAELETQALILTETAGTITNKSTYGGV